MHETTIPTLYAMLSSFCFAGCLMEHFAIAPGWAVISKSGLPTLHKLQSDAIATIYVIPKITLTIWTGVMLFSPPTAGVPSWVVQLGTLMLAISWVISIGLQFPLQRKIRLGDQKAVGSLVFNNWFRVGCMGALWFGVLVGVVF